MKFWADNTDHIVVYHGTHKDNIPYIRKNGISNKDPKTGMISVAFGSHGKNVAHGYAAMSGERFFRQAGKKAVTVPKEDRRVVVAHLPMDWVRANVDTDFGGNPSEIKTRLRSREAHKQFVTKHGTDFLPHETPELRFKEAIPPEFIVGVEKKQDKYVNNKLGDLDMRKLQEFREPTPPESPSGKPRGVKPDGYPGTQFMYSMGFNEEKPGTGILCHPNLPGENCKIQVSKNKNGEPIYTVNGEQHSDDFKAVRSAAGPHLEKLALGSVFKPETKPGPDPKPKTEHFMGFKEFVENLAEEVPANNASGEASSDGKPKVSFYDKLMRFLKRRPPKDTYNHPESAQDLAKRSSVGIPGLP